MRIELEREGCIACGLCVETCPKVFRFAKDGLAEVYGSPSPEEEDSVVQAGQNCPVNVIHVR